MNYLLDTHVLLWLEGEKRLPTALSRELSQFETKLAYSVVSLYEIAIKRAIGKLRFEPSIIEEAAAKSGIELMSLLPRHCAAYVDLPNTHCDPYDRMLMAQANCESMTVLTFDERLSDLGAWVRVLKS